MTDFKCTCVVVPLQKTWTKNLIHYKSFLDNWHDNSAVNEVISPCVCNFTIINYKPI